MTHLADRMILNALPTTCADCGEVLAPSRYQDGLGFCPNDHGRLRPLALAIRSGKNECGHEYDDYPEAVKLLALPRVGVIKDSDPATLSDPVPRGMKKVLSEYPKTWRLRHVPALKIAEETTKTA